MIEADREVAGGVGKVVVNALVPFQRKHRQDIAKSGRRVGPAAAHREADRADRGGERSIDFDAVAAVRDEQVERGLCAENLVGENVGHNAHAKVGPGLEIDVDVGGEGHRDVAARDLTRKRDIGAGGDGRVIADDGEREPGVCGVAARLPKNPGTQKLTPPSSATAALGEIAMVAIDSRAAAARLKRERVSPTPEKDLHRP